MAWVELGRIGAPYGIRGWIHVQSHTDPPERLLEYRQWTVRLASGGRLQQRIAAGRVHADGLVVQLEGIADRDAAARLTGAAIEVERAALPRLSEREYYRADLIGCAVRNLEGADLGQVSHFVEAPRGAVMVSRSADGQEHWVLANPRHLRQVDLAARRIVVDWPAQLE